MTVIARMEVRVRAFRESISMADDPAVDMCCTCSYVEIMAKMIQLRHVPEGVHRKLKSRAARLGLSLPDYLVREVTKIADQPSLASTLHRARIEVV